MASRYKPNQKKSRKKFVATALKTNPKNVKLGTMRGGYRI